MVAETIASPRTVDRTTLRAELESARTDFHALLQAVPADRWNQRTPNRSWNMRQTLWHMAWVTEWLVEVVDRCKQDNGMNPPSILINSMNKWMAKRGSRNATPESVAEKYDAAHQQLVAALNGVQDVEWAKGTKMFGRFQTVELTLHIPRMHVDEHSRHIRQALQR